MAHIAETVDQELLLLNEYLVAENRIIFALAAVQSLRQVSSDDFQALRPVVSALISSN
jgi:hypothetical protein